MHCLTSGRLETVRIPRGPQMMYPRPISSMIYGHAPGVKFLDVGTLMC